MPYLVHRLTSAGLRSEVNQGLLACKGPLAKCYVANVSAEELNVITDIFCQILIFAVDLGAEGIKYGDFMAR